MRTDEELRKIISAVKTIIARETKKVRETIDGINKDLVEIERVRGFLDAVKLKDDWISDMQRKVLILESHHSTHIEGTAISLKQAQEILSGRKVKGVSRADEKELLNYKKAMDFISKYLGKDDPISEGPIRELHKILVRGVRGS